MGCWQRFVRADPQLLYPVDTLFGSSATTGWLLAYRLDLRSKVCVGGRSRATCPGLRCLAVAILLTGLHVTLVRCAST